PLLVSAGQIEKNNDIFAALATVFGLDFTTKIIDLADTGHYKVVMNRSGEVYGMHINAKQQITHHFQDISLDILLADFLSNSEIVLLIDGFDEIIPDLKVLVEKQINELAQRIPPPAILVTCRSHFISVDKAYFIELTPSQLTTAQRMAILDRNLINKEYSSFKIAISESSLCHTPGKFEQIIYLIKNKHLKAEEAISITPKQIIHKLKTSLEDGISKQYREELIYVGFITTFVEKVNSFPYNFRCDYWLEANLVVRFDDSDWRFADTFTKELCAAQFIVNQRLNFEFMRYCVEINCYPFVYAILLHDEPTELFYLLINAIHRGCRSNMRANIYKRLLSELQSFSAYFSPHEKLGIAFLKIIIASDNSKLATLCRNWLKSNNVLHASIIKVMQNYTVNNRRHKDNHICYELNIDHAFNFYPYELDIPAHLNELINRNSTMIVKNGHSY
ncbi:MAG: hypothetical protein WCF67_07855, partial [Chitinophagaceae bacterium]